MLILFFILEDSEVRTVIIHGGGGGNSIVLPPKKCQEDMCSLLSTPRNYVTGSTLIIIIIYWLFGKRLTFNSDVRPVERKHVGMILKIIFRNAGIIRPRHSRVKSSSAEWFFSPLSLLGIPMITVRVRVRIFLNRPNHLFKTPWVFSTIFPSFVKKINKTLRTDSRTTWNRGRSGGKNNHRVHNTRTLQHTYGF